VKAEFFSDGAPIPEERLESIFDKFERLDTAVEGQGLAFPSPGTSSNCTTGRSGPPAGPRPELFYGIIAANKGVSSRGEQTL